MTLTDIANIALEDVGAKPIGNIDGDDVSARKIKRRLPLSIFDVASRRNWSCLIKIIELSRVENKHINGRYLYNKPRGLLKILSPDMCEIEGDYIVSPAETLVVRASIITHNPDDWDENLRGAILAQLRADIAFMVSGDAQLAAQVKALSAREIERYMRNDFYRAKGRQPRPPLLPDGYHKFI